ncbi:MAG: hypothetical protein HY651_03420 [Acidobacteria bacterium]|nr:hypothetical protein [Acidobacteriota bacterium]
MTHDEIRAEYVRSMGPDLGQLYHELEDEVGWLHLKWGEFLELYGKGSERIDLLNEVASSFFYLVQQMLFEGVLLHLCRLTDPPESWSLKLKTKVPNLSLQLLADLIPDPSLKARVEAGTQVVLTNCKFARDWRNRRGAHSDLMTFRNKHVTPLPSGTIKQVEDALASIRNLHDLVGPHYGHPPVAFSWISNPWGAQSLLPYLEIGVRAEKEEMQRWRKLAQGEAGEA